MQLPDELQSAIDEITQKSASLKKAREELTRTYREGGNSKSIFSDEARRLAYLGTRMPATYAAVYKALQQIPFPCTRFLDIGAGPGTASWAAAELFPSLEKVTLIEQSPEAIALGKMLVCHSTNNALQQAEWIQRSLPTEIPSADVAVLSYVLNEVKDPLAVVELCWKAVSTLVIVEPGTPKGFQLIRKIRQHLIDRGAYLIAPCPHSFACPVQGTDWCHFSARIERTRLHRLLKEGTLGHEDEKFSYLVASKIPVTKPADRIVRHPQKQSGHVRLTLCTLEGKLEERVITRSDKENYRKARDAEWGDEPRP